KIKSDIDTAARDKEDAKKLMEEYDRRLKDINKEAEEILSAARQKALKNEARIIEEAKEEAGRIMARANAQVELERKKAADDMKKEIISIASLMAGKVVKASIDMEVQDSLIEDTLKEIGDQTWQS
ncbi:ATP synthase F0 subunit B, partial [Clostridioides difficile]